MAQQPSRREFLKCAAAASVGAAALCRNVFAFRRFSCVVIGAGLSGLSAAVALQKAGWSVTVIDARDRIGGRVLSYSFAEQPNLVCELGGEWIGESHERIKAHCHDLGLELKEHRFQTSLMRNGRVSQPGQWDFSKPAQNGFENLRNRYHKLNDAQKLQLDKVDWPEGFIHHST